MRILAVYDSADKAAVGAAAVRQAGLGDVLTYSPTADPVIVAPYPSHISQVRLFTLLGGLLGCAVGIALPMYTMLNWPSVVGGKAMVSIPPIVVIAFELSMLCAALGGFLGFLVLGGLPWFGAPRGFDKRFTDDRFGILVTCSDEQTKTVQVNLEMSGAEEVRQGV